LHALGALCGLDRLRQLVDALERLGALRASAGEFAAKVAA